MDDDPVPLEVENFVNNNVGDKSDESDNEQDKFLHERDEFLDQPVGETERDVTKSRNESGLRPRQPKLWKFPINKDINTKKTRSFVKSWYGMKNLSSTRTLI